MFSKSWSSAECARRELDSSPMNQRMVLQSILKLIRFPLMTMEEFTSFVTPRAVLSDLEELSLLRYFLQTPKPKTEFSNKPRANLTLFEAISKPRASLTLSEAVSTISINSNLPETKMKKRMYYVRTFNEIADNVNNSFGYGNRIWYGKK